VSAREEKMKGRLALLLATCVVLFVFSVAYFQKITGAIESLESELTEQENYAASETWVDDDFNESTPGWGVTNFHRIQDGINAVTSGGTVHVASGSYYENVAVNRTVFLVGEDKSRTIIDGNYTRDSVLSITANYVSIEGFAIQNCIYLGREKGGIDINSWYSDISNIDFTQNWIDLTVLGEFNRISSCIMNASFWNIKILADNNSVLENHFSNSYTAISLTTANGNAIENNTVTDEYLGISLYESTQNRIAANSAFNCSQKALTLESYSTNNIVIENTFSNCYQGVDEDANSGGNTFYHNSFIHNTFQASLAGAGNSWDNGYPVGGNYWESNAGKDEKRGPNQDEVGSDGIFDTTYTIDTNNRDRYPLTKPYRGSNDVGLVSFTCSKTAIPENHNANMSANVINFGFTTEIAHLTLRLNATILYETDTSIKSRNSTAFMFTLNTTGMAKGRYSLEAHVNPVTNETDTADNTRILYIAVTFPGDVDGDLTVDIYDAIALAGAYDSVPQTPSWNPNADINSDNIVDIYDAIFVSSTYGKKI
jgi:parallel beta-helix repeat protein